MIVKYIKIPKLLYGGNPDCLSYPIYKILDDNSSGYLEGNTNYGKQDLTLATKIAGAKGFAEFLGKQYLEWEKPSQMTARVFNEQYDFLNDDIEIHIEVVE